MTLEGPHRAVAMAFLVHGVAVSAWVARIPQIKAELGLTAGALGLALLGGPAGVVAAVRFAGLVVARWGSRTVTRAGGVLAALSLVPLGLAGNIGVLVGALALLGAASGIMDVAMNAQGVAVERWYGRPLMSGLHGAYSIGTIGGALAGAAAAHLEVPVPLHMAAVALVLLVLVAGGTRGLLARSAEPPPPAEPAGGGAVRSGRRTLIMLGVIGLCSFVGEGAMTDWSAVHLRETLGTGAGVAGLGYAGCAGAMTAVRLAGDKVVARLGPVRVLRGGAVLAAAGLGGGLLGGSVQGGPVPAVLGFTLFGLGVALVAPITFSAAGNVPGVPAATGISWVTSIGYTGFLAGPPLIGLVAEAVGLTWALAVPVGLAALIAVLAGATRTAA